jgi:hypothetical protein
VTIQPDDKDWTWVVNRPCPQCGFNPGEVDVTAMPSMIDRMSEEWRNVLLGDEVTLRPTPSTWSPLEYACHVRDVFRLFATRLEAMITTDGAQFANWDQDATAVAMRYDRQDPLVVADELEEAARGLAEQFRKVHGDLWGHRGLRSNGSEFTVRTFALYFAHDPVHHLWDVGGDPRLVVTGS